MPKYFCEYCGIYLIHSGPWGRRQHNTGKKHIQNKIDYYNQIILEQQKLMQQNSMFKFNMLSFSKPGLGLGMPFFNNNFINPMNNQLLNSNSMGLNQGNYLNYSRPILNNQYPMNVVNGVNNPINMSGVGNKVGVPNQNPNQNQVHLNPTSPPISNS